jgi:dihydroflavonol-4-reductase
MNGCVIAVTGASGFVGGWLIRELLANGDRPVAVVRHTSNTTLLGGVPIRRADVTRPDELQAAFAGCDAVIHLAGVVDFGGDWPRFIEGNMVGTANALAAARAAGVRRFVHGSSIVAVGAGWSPVRLTESARWNLEDAVVPYVTTKRRAEELARAATRPGFEVVIANLASVVGPEDDSTQSEFGVLCRRYWKGRLPVHFGGGLNYVDVRDAARGLRLALERGRAGERYILGGANRSTAAFFGELGRAAGRAIPHFLLPNGAATAIAWAEQTLGSRRRGRAYLSPGQARLVRRYFYFDTSKARDELGFVARPLSQSLADAFTHWRRAAA